MRLSRAGATQLRIDYASADDTARAGIDYTATSGSLTFSPGETIKSFIVPIIADSLNEPTEYLRLSLTNPQGVILGTPNRASLAIFDGAPRPAISIENSGVVEGDANSALLSFILRLSAPSTSEITVQAQASNSTASSGSDFDPLPATAISFPPGSTTRQIAVTVRGDTLYEADERLLITLSRPVNATLATLGATGTIINDDRPPIVRWSVGDRTVSESAGRVVLTVELDQQSGLPVQVGYTLSGTATAADHTLATGTLTIPAGALSTSARFTITDDQIDEDAETLILTLSGPVGATLGAPGIQSITIEDNDTAAVVLTPSNGLVTSESGSTDSFSVALTSQPTATVTINLASSATSEGTLSSGSIVFTPANWNTPQSVTVTGVDDAIDDDDITYRITATSTSADPKYDLLVPTAVSVVNLDNDVRGISIAPTSGLVTSEAGTTDSFSVVLNTKPIANVTVTLISDLSEGNVTPASLIFTPGSWNTAQVVTVTGVDDFVDDGNIDYLINTSVASADPLYNAYPLDDVSLSNTDNDSFGMSITPSGVLATSEAGLTDTLSIALNSEPTAAVTVSLASSDTTEGTVTPTSLVFTPANWNTPQIATATGVDDALADGNIDYTIITSVTSADANYNGFLLGNVTLSNIDNDTLGLGIIASGPSSSEAGGTVELTVTMANEPTADVTVTLESSDTSEGTVTPTSLVFTPANWNVPQSATVVGVDDAINDGDVNYTIITTVTSAEPRYDGFALADVSLTNADDEIIAVSIDDPTLTESNGGTVNIIFNVTLSITSTTAVSIDYATADGTALSGADYTATGGVLTFAPGVATGQITVTVKGDLAIELDEQFQINLSNPSAGGLPISLADGQGLGTIVNDDWPSLRFAQNDYSVSENIGTALVTVQLSAPAPFAITVDYTAVGGTATNTDYTLVPDTISFAPGQTVASFGVTLLDDVLVEKPSQETVQLQLLAPSPVGTTISGPNPATLTINDDDAAPVFESGSYFHTAAPDADPNSGYWYTSNAPVKGYNYLVFHIPCVAGSPAVQIDLFSPTVSDDPNPAADDDGDTDIQDDVIAPSTIFELYGPGTTVGPATNIPAPGGPGSITSTTYNLDQYGDVWVAFATLPPGSCGTYLLRSQTLTVDVNVGPTPTAEQDDINSWGIRLGWEMDGDLSTPPVRDADGIAGSGDEVVIGVLQGTLQHISVPAGDVTCTTLYQYVASGLAEVRFHNFDLDYPPGFDNNAKVRYYPPGASYDPTGQAGVALNDPAGTSQGYIGTAAGPNVWNGAGATELNRVGDVVNNPENGWWRIVTCTSLINTFVQEGQSGVPLYFEQPPTPTLATTLVGDRDSAMLAETVNFDISVMNISSGASAGLAAETTLTVTLPTELQFEVGSCRFDGLPTGGSCTSAGNLLTLRLDRSLAAGAMATLRFAVTVVSVGIPGPVVITLDSGWRDTLVYGTSLGNRALGPPGSTSLLLQ